MIRNRPTPEGVAFGERLARLHRASVEAARSAEPGIPDPCRTCAFRRGTVPNGCWTTVRDAMKCVVEANQFDCHEELGPDGHPVAPCSGWLACTVAAGGEPPGRVPWDYSDGETTESVRSARD